MQPAHAAVHVPTSCNARGIGCLKRRDDPASDSPVQVGENQSSPVVVDRPFAGTLSDCSANFHAKAVPCCETRSAKSKLCTVLERYIGEGLSFVTDPSSHSHIADCICSREGNSIFSNLLPMVKTMVRSLKLNMRTSSMLNAKSGFNSVNTSPLFRRVFNYISGTLL